MDPNPRRRSPCHRLLSSGVQHRRCECREPLFHGVPARPDRTPAQTLYGVAASRRCDCEDHQRSLMVVGCGLVIAGVTPGVTGFVPCCDLSARGCRPRPGWRSWPDQELDHPALAAPGVSHHSPAEPPSRTGTTSRPAKERTHEQSDRSAWSGRRRHRRRHPRPHPLRGGPRHRDWWCPRRDHRRGDTGGLCRSGGVRQQAFRCCGPGRSRGPVAMAPV